MTDQKIVKRLAEKVMGWYKDANGWCWFTKSDDWAATPEWDPLTDANDMLMVIEAMREKEWKFGCEPWSHEQYRVTFTKWYLSRGEWSYKSYYHTNLLRAVCLAALKAIDADKEQG